MKEVYGIIKTLYINILPIVSIIKFLFCSLQLTSLFGYNSSYKSLNNCYFHLINDIPSIYNSVIIKQTFKNKETENRFA